MNTHTHTPGPWHVNPRGFIVQSTGDIITRLECSNNNDNDARLIASAPELLSALKLIYANAGESPEWIRARIGSVISKAEGVK
jgi:hypothetical protein